MIFETTILGCGAAAPTGKHSPSAQVLNIHDKLFLVDCGEGTQMQMRKFKVKMQRINEVFITHMHGDHFYGLPVSLDMSREYRCCFIVACVCYVNFNIFAHGKEIQSCIVMFAVRVRP